MHDEGKKKFHLDFVLQQQGFWRKVCVCAPPQRDVFQLDQCTPYIVSSFFFWLHVIIGNCQPGGTCPIGNEMPSDIRLSSLIIMALVLVVKVFYIHRTIWFVASKKKNLQTVRRSVRKTLVLYIPKNKIATKSIFQHPPPLSPT